jgi:hypothetical protein
MSERIEHWGNQLHGHVNEAAWACERSGHQSTRLVAVFVLICKQNKSDCFQVDSWSQNEDLKLCPNIDWKRENAYLCSP